MWIQPDSNCTLYSNVSIGTGEELVFSSLEKQREYFNKHKVREFVNMTVNRKTGVVKLECPGSVVKNCNYMSFRNPSFDNKEIYCRITDYEYLSPDVTQISYDVDYFQTWLFEYRIESAVIDREHLSKEDFTKAENNPFDNSIYEFNTPEELVVGRELEKLYQIACRTWQKGSSGSDGDGFLYPSGYAYNSYTDSSVGDSSQYDAESENWDTPYNGGYENGRPFIVMMISPFDEDEKNLAEWLAIKNLVAQYGYYKLHDSNVLYTTGAEGMRTVTAPDFSTNVKPYTILAVDLEEDFTYHSGEREGEKTTNSQIVSRILNYFSIQGLTSAIIGMWCVPKFVIRQAYFGFSSLSTPRFSEPSVVDSRSVSVAPKVPNTYSKKLARMPYNYLRVTSANGDEKEFDYTKFSSISNINIPSEDRKAYFRSIGLLNGNPSFSLVPVAYKKFTAVKRDDVGFGDESLTKGYGYLNNLNFDERIIFDMFPQIPYSTDGYLNFLGNTYNAAQAANTQTFQNSQKFSRFNATADAVLGLANMLPGIGGLAQTSGGSAKAEKMKGEKFISGISGGTGIVSNFVGTALETQSKERILEDAINVQNNGEYTVSNEYADVRSAYALADYNPGTQGGLQFYLKGVSRPDFTFTRVELLPEVQKRFDEYFKNYGYRSGRAGVPRVFNFIQGVSDNDKIPEFVPESHHTFCRTVQIHVTGVMAPVAEYIEGIYQNGCRFVNGEQLD